jgi:hypothetical protein
MDTATFLTIVTILIGLILSAVGAYLILVLHEARTSLKHLNRILNRLDKLAEFVDEKIARPGAGFASIFGVLNEGLQFFQDLKKTVRKNRDDEEKQDER